jgi:hypothetical protein
MSENLHRVSECSHVIVGSAAGGTLAVVAAVAGQRAGIYRMILTTPSTVTVTIQDTGSNPLSQAFAFGASGGSIALDTPVNGDPWWQSNAGLGLQLNLSAAVQVSADFWFLQGP